jgi:hypothetical protein
LLVLQTEVQEAARKIRKSLKERFPAVTLMQALGVLHPAFFVSRGSRARGDFNQLQQHAAVLIRQYGEEHHCKDDKGVGYTCPALIDPVKLKEQLPVYFRAAKHISKEFYRVERSRAGDSEHEWSDTEGVRSDSE